jgi:hypothetical protein
MMLKYCSIRNVRRALPYFQHSITDAKDRAREIGNCKETDYEPEPVINPANQITKGIKQKGISCRYFLKEMTYYS